MKDAYRAVALEWKARLEAALSDETECDNLLRVDTRAEAFRWIRAYLDEAYIKLGPSFLERAALAAAARQANPAPPSWEVVPAAAALASSPEESSEAPKVLDFTQEAAGGPNASTSCNADQSIASKTKGRLKMVVPYKTKQLPLHRCPGGGIKIAVVRESRGTLHSSYDSLPSPLIHKVQGALKSSYSELQAAVCEPLPDALHVAASLVPCVADTAPNLGPPPQNHVSEDIHATDPSLHNSATEAAPSMLDDYQMQPRCHRNMIPRHSLMERNGSAQTYQWGDSPEGMSEQKGRPQLHSPKRLDVFLLRIVKPQKVSKHSPREVLELKGGRNFEGWSEQVNKS